MKATGIGILCAATVLFLGARSQAALVLSEVLANEVGGDTTGEWIEFYNTGAAALDLTDYKIGDEEASGQSSLTELLVRFPAGASIPAGGVQILAVSATTFFTNYGFNPTYEVNSTDPSVPDMAPYPAWDLDGGVISMSNTNDQAVIVGPSDTVLDAASWGNSFAFNPSLPQPVLDGQSWERINVLIDTDTANDWQLGPNPSGATAAQRSTPGVARIPEPSSLALLAGLGVLGGAIRRKRH
jgi:hypothetical protein